MATQPEPAIELLHLSDPQFGKNHRFGSAEPLDSLLHRLTTDLDRLAADQDLHPDLLVLTGDLAEWAMPDEFDQVHAFIVGVAEHLRLARDRVVIVPGNHDISRKRCHAHFLTREADGLQPVRPYWPKWEPYKALFDRLYADQPNIGFDVDEPWTLFEMPGLRLVVAGLNSTIKESHLDDDHYGWLGEDQLEWFAAKLAEYRSRGWLRIGAVHHN